ncbi:hypothetical protein EIK77_006028 [Talaromyces pinophilus]|nr:hypothetical protein EIK77_006028 [Talaromyces pinophilus]
MYWKAILVGLAGLSTSARADIAFGSCPSGYSMTTYVQTIVTQVSQVASSAKAGVPATSTSVLPSPSSASTGIATPSATASTASTQSAAASASPVSPTLQYVQVPSIAPTAGVLSSTLVSPVSNSPSVSPTSVSSTSVSSTSVSSTSVSSTSSSSQESPSSSSSSAPLGGIMHGQATSYDGGDVDGTCMFATAGYTLPMGIYGAALSVDNWDTSASCGACVSQIVNQCPGDCGLNHLDLLPNGFTQLADLKVGRIDVDWEFVKCDISSPLYLSTQSGSSKYWFSMQVVNSNVPVKSLEVSTDGGNTWQPTTRSEYNFFQNASGFGVDYVDVRITSATGETIVVKNANSAGETRTDATSNFS